MRWMRKRPQCSYIIFVSLCKARKVSKNAQLSQVVADTLPPSPLRSSSLILSLWKFRDAREVSAVQPMAKARGLRLRESSRMRRWIYDVHAKCASGEISPRRANDRRVPYFSRNELRLYIRALSGNCEIFLADHTVFYDRDFGSFPRALTVRHYPQCERLALYHLAVVNLNFQLSVRQSDWH